MQFTTNCRGREMRWLFRYVDLKSGCKFLLKNYCIKKKLILINLSPT